jgi:hypothetical protein
MMHSAGPQQAQYQQITHMGPTMSAHPHYPGPTRPTHSPQQMAQHVMGLENHDPYDPNDPSRKRTKVSRACDECRRKKVRITQYAPTHMCVSLTACRSDATPLPRTGRKPARVARGQVRVASSAVNP